MSSELKGFNWRPNPLGGTSWNIDYYPTGKVIRSNISDHPNSSIWMWGGVVESITDELAYRKRIGYVDHTLREVEPKSVSYLSGVSRQITNYRAGMSPYGPIALAVMPNSVTVGYRVQAEAVYAVQQVLGGAFSSMSGGSLPAKVDADPAPLVGKIMRRLNKFNGATYLAEMKDLPQLASWLARRAKILTVFGSADGRGLNYFRLANASKKLQRFILRVTKKNVAFWQLSQADKVRVLHSLAADQGSDAYLGAIFGLFPTVNETRQLASELAAQRKKRSEFTVTERLDTRAKPGNVTANGYGVCSKIVLTDTSYCTSVVGARVGVVHNPYVSQEVSNVNTWLDQHLGYNPMSPVWAIIPFSFVVDWLFGVDNMLDAAFLSTTKKVDIQWWRSTKLERSWLATASYPIRVTSETVINLNVAPSYSLIYANEQFTGRYSRYIRESTLQPIGTFAPKVPRIPSSSKVFTLVLMALGLTKR